MRKGADVLNKWVGESERQLKNLFEQARLMQPSIIFFDEIDGLAPVRSSKQDQIHSSIVTTLLALMDGLDSRGVFMGERFRFLIVQGKSLSLALRIVSTRLILPFVDPDVSIVNFTFPYQVVQLAKKSFASTRSKRIRWVSSLILQQMGTVP